MTEPLYPQSRLRVIWSIVWKVGGGLATLATLYFTYQQYRDSHATQEERFIERGAAHCPKLELLSATAVNVHPIAMDQRTEFVPKDTVNGVPEGRAKFSAGIGYEADIELLYQNRGNEDVIAEQLLTSCSPNYDATIRARLLSDSATSFETGADQPSVTYEPDAVVIRPGEKFSPKLKVMLNNGITPNVYTVHVCIPYKSIYGNWYDVYAWLDVDAKAWASGYDSTRFHLPLTPSDPHDSVGFYVDCTFDSRCKGSTQNVYSYAESRVVEKRLRTLRKRR